MSAPDRRSKTRHVVHVSWRGVEPTTRGAAFEALVRASGCAIQFDDGRGRDPWYHAERGDAERALRAKCVALLGRPPDEVSV